MDKLKMAHELLVSALKGGVHLGSGHAGTAQYFFDLADAMQAEAVKRAVEPDVGNADVSDFQIDWSVAPSDYDWWAVDQYGSWWFDQEPKWIKGEWGGYVLGKNDRSATKKAPTFGYTGAWQDSLRKHPTT